MQGQLCHHPSVQEHERAQASEHVCPLPCGTQITVDWLRRCVRAAPALRLQVLVTGSLYVVGDLLCLLQPGSPPSGAPPPPR